MGDRQVKIVEDQGKNTMGFKKSVREIVKGVVGSTEFYDAEMLTVFWETKPEIVKYLESLPSKAELKEILRQLGKPSREIIRFYESAAKEAGIGPDDVRDLDEWLDILTQHPELMQRPIVVKDGQARIGQPPEDVLEII